MSKLISPFLNWLDGIFRSVPLEFLEIFGRLGLFIGLVLAALVYGRFTFRCGDRWAFGREQQEWNTKAMLGFVLTMVLIIGSGIIGKNIVIVPGAQTLESLKDLSVFVCVLVFGYPALLAIAPAYMLADMIEGVPPSWVLLYTPAYLTICGYHWVGYQLFGKNPDFRKPSVWAQYALFVAFFLPVYSAYWGYVCGPMFGNFPTEISYHVITPALFITLVGTWIMAPFAMLGALPLTRKLGLFWAEIPGHVRVRRVGGKVWEWVSGPPDAHPTAAAQLQRVPIHLLVAGPCVGLVLIMVALVAFIAMRSGDAASRQLAERLHREIADNIQMQVDKALSVPGLDPSAETASLNQLLQASRIAKEGRGFILDHNGHVLASSNTAPPGTPDSIVEAALSGLHQLPDGTDSATETKPFRFDYVTASPLSRETWLAQIAPFHDGGGEQIGQLITALPESNFLGELRAGNTHVAIIITVALILALVMAMLLAGALAHPLQRLAHSADVLAQGDLAKRVPPSRLAEVDTVASAFNHMGGQLQAFFERTRASEEKLRTVLDTSPLPISWVNSAGVIEFWNRKALALFGYATDEIDTAVKWYRRAYPDPEYRKEVIDRWSASGAGLDCDINQGEYDITCKDGRVITTEVFGTRLGDLTLAIFNDITERKRTEEELRRHRDHMEELVAERTAELAEANTSLEKTVQELELYRYMLDKATTAVYLIDEDGTLVYVNECAAQYAGYTAAELTGKHIGFLNYENTDELWTARWTKVHALTPGELDVDTMTHHRKDGTTYPIEVFAHHITHEGRCYQLSMGVDITERQKIRDQLDRTLSLSDLALSLTHSSYWVVPLDGSGYYNGTERNAEIFGDPPAPGWRYLVSHWKDCVAAADPAAADSAWAAFLRFVSGEAPGYNVTYPYRRPVDGRVVWIHSLGVRMKNEASGFMEVHGVNQDITETIENRKALEEANASLEKTVQELELYRYMLDKATTAIYLIDRSGRFIYVNECAAQYSGYTREELLGLNVTDIHVGQTPEGWENRWHTVHALPEGKLDVTRMLHRRKDGSIYPIAILAHHIHHEGLDYQLSIGIDITERERAEARLQRVLALNEQAMELTHSGYWSVPLDGSDYYISSERTVAILGETPNPEWQYGLAEWGARIEAASPESAKDTLEKFAKACSGETPSYDTIFPYKRPADGRIVWLHALGVVIRDNPEHPPEMYGVAQDVTDIVEARRELEAARKAAETANRLKSEFLANMSHEIRTPMNGVLGMADLLSHTHLDADQREQLAMLKGSGEDLLTIINDILDFSKIEAGRMELETIGFSLHDMVSRTLQTLAPQAATKKLEIELDIPVDLPDLRLGDPNRLRQVLINLAGNAIKFTERGWVRVVVAQGQGPHDLRVEVTDTGVGISPEVQTRLFQPFSQADASTTRKHGGTGLGLVISARIIQQMGGRTGISSMPGRGSTFWFELSLPQATPEQVVGPDFAMPDALPMLAGKRVLLVDDNSVNRAVAGTMMRRWGMKVSEAADGLKALAQVHAIARPDDAGYDLALLDGVMPGMDGWQLAAAIRKIPGCATLPLVMASSSGLEPNHSPKENSPFRRFLIKPLRPAQLAGALAEALTGWHPGQAEPIPKAVRGARVLLVEDTKVNQMAARAMLEKGGHQVTLAENGVEALAQLKQPGLFDIILMDCQMPEMDGFEATRQLRLREQERGWKPYRVVAMTANAMQSDKDACLEAGMDGYLAKPVQMNQLLKTVAEERTDQ